MSDKNTIRSSAMIPGLVLGAIPAVYTLLIWVIDGFKCDSIAAVGIRTVADVLLWIAKFLLCISVFKMYMKRFASDNSLNGEGVSGRDIFIFGMWVAFFSAVIYAGFYLAYLTYINPDLFGNVLEVMKQQMPADAYNTALLEQMENSLPDMTHAAFFLQLLYCFCFGTVLSAIYTKKFTR